MTTDIEVAVSATFPAPMPNTLAVACADPTGTITVAWFLATDHGHDIPRIGDKYRLRLDPVTTDIPEPIRRGFAS